MDLRGQIRTTCPPDLLVGIMRDPEALARLLPKDSRMEQTAEGAYAFSISKSFGPIKLTLPGQMYLTTGGNGSDQQLKAHAAHMIGGKVDLALTIRMSTEGRTTLLAYDGDLTASGLAGRILQQEAARANASLKAALIRLKVYAEAQAIRQGA